MKISQGASKVSNDKQVTPRAVFILGGEDVRSPSNPEYLRESMTHKNRKWIVIAEKPWPQGDFLPLQVDRGYSHNHGENYVTYNVKCNHVALQISYMNVSCAEPYIGNNEENIGDICAYIRYALY